ncbi:lysozyme family protein [Flavobacterium ajazii]|uniref:hypothetical protein n=1 Tax=Flavobacterium ajazii TaxID=2692318 RepID=UPI001CB74D0E|nr:hypothetical protein [Flavobacterium ajazii]
MAKGVKKIKRLSNSFQFDDYFKSGDIICINPNQEALFAVGEWHNETTEEEKRRNITWLWMDQKKIEKFNTTIKPAGVPYGVTLPKKLCGRYAYYLEVSLDGRHDRRNTGVNVFGKCEKKIISASWSKKRNTADHSQINYGQDLFITLETEGLNGDTLTLELYSQKGSKLIDSVKENCTDGILKGKFKIKSFYREFPGLPETLENFYIKVLDFEKDYIKNASGSDKILSFKIIKTNSIIAIPVFEIPTNTTPLIIADTPGVEEVKTEGIISAYFAKEEFTKETTEIDGQHEYKFANPNIKYDKNKIAGIIKSKVDTLVKADKKYAKLDDIKNALVEESYAKDTTITFNLCKLGAEYKKINSAPLEEEVYVIAKTFLLDGKEISITIKEKETIIVDADVAVPVLEAKEDGAELTTLKATVENGLAKVKVKLRPKADEDLKIWKEKLLKGKKEEAYTYTFKSEETTITVDNKKQFAAIILKNAKEGKQGNTKIATGKTAFADDVEKALENKTYKGGDPITFDTYKTQAESLWLKAECQGETVKHEGEFLKRDGEYFVIGGNDGCKIDEKYFFEEYSKKFNGISEDQKSSLTKIFKSTAEYYTNEKRCCNLKHIAYMLATAKLETAHTFNPINEYGGNSYFERMYDPILGKDENRRQMAKDAENTIEGDGVKYHGRGFVQLTWKKNYRKMKEKFGVDLINHPEKALDHELAMKIMIYGMEQGSFTDKKLSDYINGSKTDYLNARRIINGTDRASDIKDYAQEIEKCLKIQCNCTGKDNSESNVNIHFVGQSAHEDAVSQNSINILKEVGRASNNNDIYITSTARTPHDQARIMFDNCERDLQEQRNTYLEPGQKIIDVYVTNVNKTRNQVISLMEAKINELGPTTVSKHCANPNVINVFDVPISRLINPNDFLTEIQKRTEVDQVLIENAVYHVEITQ